MHTGDEEFFVFLRFADGDVSQALMALDHIPKTDIEFIRLSLLKDALISYCRPFKKCRGTYKKNLNLDASFVPANGRTLHKELLDLRDQVLAHTDLDIRAAKLHCWTRGSNLIFPIQFKGYDYPQFLLRVEELRSLFNEVLESIRNQHQALEVEFLKRIPKGTAPGSQININL